MKRYLDKNKLITAIAVSAAMVLPSLAVAKVSGPCGDCHTMHNSQDGTEMASTGAFGSAGVPGTAANGALLRYGCIGCHTGTNSAASTVPFVLGTSAAYGTDTLAGGSFFWVLNGSVDASSQNATGHNVITLPGVTSDIAAPGGGVTAMPSDTLTCAGTTGCHGNQGVADEFGSIAGGHHGDGGTLLADTTKTLTSGSTTDMSDAFRMLAGIIGIEDDDWEYTNSPTDHNQYYGVDRTTEVTAPGSISELCANCHGDFHSGVGMIGESGMSSPWMRHPTDFDMANVGLEYQYFNGSAGGANATAAYSTETPLASNVMTAVIDTVNVGTGNANDTAIVTCLSCHRAHGSPYDDLLRWKYSDMDAHAGTSVGEGCFRCHTTKDDV